MSFNSVSYWSTNNVCRYVVYQFLLFYILDIEQCLSQHNGILAMQLSYNMKSLIILALSFSNFCFSVFVSARPSCSLYSINYSFYIFKTYKPCKTPRFKTKQKKQEITEKNLTLKFWKDRQKDCIIHTTNRQKKGEEHVHWFCLSHFLINQTKMAQMGLYHSPRCTIKKKYFTQRKIQGVVTKLLAGVFKSHLFIRCPRHSLTFLHSNLIKIFWKLKLLLCALEYGFH